MATPTRVGRYEIEVVVGQGAIGRVFLARDSMLGRQVALKLVRDDLALTPDGAADLAAQFRKWARDAARLSHPAIAPLHDFGEDPAFGVYTVSELVPGISLRERMARGRLLPGEVIPIARAVGSALGYAHAEAVVHGHLKPENILLSPHGPKVVDFGSPGSAPPAPETPAAVTAPECIAGAPPTPRSDQYAFAAILYEALTERPPVPVEAPASSAAKAATNITWRRPPTGEAESRKTARLDAVFDCALAREPRRRFPSCEVFAEALVDALEATNPTLPTAPTSQSSLIPRATRQWQNAAAGSAVLVILALVGFGGQHHGGTEGVSFKGVAQAFSASFSGARPPLGTEHSHVNPPPPVKPSSANASVPLTPPSSASSSAKAPSASTSAAPSDPP